MLDVMKGIAEPLQSELHLDSCASRAALLITVVFHLRKQVNLLKAIPFAIGSFGDLQPGSWDIAIATAMAIVAAPFGNCIEPSADGVPTGRHHGNKYPAYFQISIKGRNPVSWIGCWVLKNQHQDLRPVPGQEDVCDTHWAALCPGMRLSDERCQHLRVMLTAWYLVEVRLGEAGVFAERWQTVKANELHFLQTRTSLSPAAVTEDQNVSQASSMRDAQLSGGSQQQRSPQLQSVSSAVSPVSSSEDNAGSEALPRPSFIQKHLLLKLTRLLRGVYMLRPQACSKRGLRGKERARSMEKCRIAVSTPTLSSYSFCSFKEVDAIATDAPVTSNDLESHVHAQSIASNNKLVRRSTANRVLLADPESEPFVNANDMPVRPGQPADKCATAQAGEQAAAGGQNSAIAQSRAPHISPAGIGQNKGSSAFQPKGKAGTSTPAAPHLRGGFAARAAQQAVTQRESLRRAEADEAVGI
ncbi:MAG: hypothetical protein FRX49_07205 [Trebouxia sp. A1-2]|nr:MAG: hypothetical protein FRX49_07205 [Trebouxia sp. A1-2]